MSIGLARVNMSPGACGSLKRGNERSANSVSNKVESTYALVGPAKMLFLWCHANKFSFSFSFSGFRERFAKPLGVPIGVVSAVDERSRSLTEGEKCKGGGVSRESRFTEYVRMLGKRYMFYRI